MANDGLPAGFRDQLRAFIEALDDIIVRTGPANQPPGFDEALAASERWADREAEVLWTAVRDAIAAYSELVEPVFGLHGNTRNDGVRLDLEGPLERGYGTLLGIARRWQMHRVEDDDEGIHISLGMTTMLGEDGRKDLILIPTPDVETAEHRALVWVSTALSAARIFGEIAEECPPAPVDEAAIVTALRNDEKPLQAAFVEFMAGRREAPINDLMAAIYGEDQEKTDDAIKKLIRRLNRSLEAIPSRLSYSLKSGYVCKHEPIG